MSDNTNPDNQNIRNVLMSIPIGVGLRAAAILIDLIIILLFYWILALITGQTTSSGFELKGIPFFAGSLCTFAYFIYFEGSKGATIGKLISGLKVIKADGSPCTYQCAIIRTIFRLIDGILFYLVGALFVWFSKNKQRLGDKLAGTIVICTKHCTLRNNNNE